MFVTACSTNYRREGQSLGLLPIGLEFAENAGNVTRQIDGKVKGSNRFQGLDFFEECFNSMSGNDRVWYALLYCAHHQLDGESLLTFRLATQPEKHSIAALSHRLSNADWHLIGQCLGIDGLVARNRVAPRPASGIGFVPHPVPAASDAALLRTTSAIAFVASAVSRPQL